MRTRLGLLLALIALPAAAAGAPAGAANQVGLTIGAAIVPPLESGGVRLEMSNSIVFGVDYARLLHDGGSTRFSLEIPFSAAPHHSVDSSSTATPGSMATLFITPSFRVNFLPRHAVSPWLSAGAGYGLYQGSTNLRNGEKNPDRFASVLALQWGGGVDVRTPMRIGVPVSLRFEVRDFYSFDSLDFNTGGGSDQHNLVIDGGLLLIW